MFVDLLIRGIDPQLSRKVRQIATERGCRINDLVLELLALGLAAAAPGPVHQEQGPEVPEVHEVDEFVGDPTLRQVTGRDAGFEGAIRDEILEAILRIP